MGIFSQFFLLCTENPRKGPQVYDCESFPSVLAIREHSAGKPLTIQYLVDQPSGAVKGWDCDSCRIAVVPELLSSAFPHL